MTDRNTGDVEPHRNPHTSPWYRFERQNYESLLSEFDLDDEAKDALFNSLVEIMVGFVDLAFGDAPVSQACGKKSRDSVRFPPSVGNLLNSSGGQSARTEPVLKLNRQAIGKGDVG